MKFLNIEFVPLDEPLENRLETLAAVYWFAVNILGFLLWIPLVYLLFTSFWWITFLTIGWMFLIDRHTPENGGRPLPTIMKCMEYLKIQTRFINYFPARLTYVPEFDLDPSRNYLLCGFPHGVIPLGPVANLLLKQGGFYNKYPNFIVRMAVTGVLFTVPFIRDLQILGLGFISCSAKSLNYVLSRPDGGNIVILSPGGTQEAYHAQPGKYKIVIKQRKSFIKLALKNGTSLVPMITFGATDLYEQIEIPFLKPFQEIIRKYLLFTPLLLNGRGLFQHSFGLLPRNKPLNTVVGKPIEIQKVSNPTTEEIEDLHKKFVEELVQLFEDYKYKYLPDPENTFLELF